MKAYITGDYAVIKNIYAGHYYVETDEEATVQDLIKRIPQGRILSMINMR